MVIIRKLEVEGAAAPPRSEFAAWRAREKHYGPDALARGEGRGRPALMRPEQAAF
jgi:hypothetical protein